MTKKIKIIPRIKSWESFINIVPATNFVPDWYKESPLTIDQTNTYLNPFQPKVTTSTYKKCTPFFDAMTLGYMIYLTSDIEVMRKDDGMPYIMWRTERNIVSEHSLQQWEGFKCPDGYSPYLYKWENHLTLKTPKDYSLLFLTPMNRMDLDFITVSGLVDTDLYDLGVHFPFFIKNNFSGIIKSGTPITQVIPIKREPWEREVGATMSPDEVLSASEKFSSTIKRSYKKNYWFKKEYR